MKGSPDRIAVCTTTYFDGIIAVIDPESSWVARWQRTCMSAFGLVRSLLTSSSQPSTCGACTQCESRVGFLMTSKSNSRVEVSSTDQETKRIKIKRCTWSSSTGHSFRTRSSATPCTSMKGRPRFTRHYPACDGFFRVPPCLGLSSFRSSFPVDAIQPYWYNHFIPPVVARK